ncbi:MAG: tyrosine-type recombinase/integrase [Clostridium sp.]
MPRKTSITFKVTKEDIANIREENLELIKDFINYLETTDHSPKSIVVYESNLYIFFTYCLHNLKNKDFVDIKKRDIMNFQNYCIKNGLSSSRIRVLKSSLSSLSNFIENILDEEEKWEDFRNVVNKIPAPTLNKVREKTVLSDEELEFLLDELVKKGKYQIACLVAFSAFSGCRKSEIVQYDRSFFVDESVRNGLYVTPEIRTKGRGVAGKKMKKFCIKSRVEKYLELWDKKREELGIDCDALFVTKRKGEWDRIGSYTVGGWMKLCGEILNKDLYHHSLRHFFVSYLNREGLPLDVIKDIVGHQDSSTTSLYNDNPTEDGFMKYFAEDGIKSVEVKGLSDL